MLTSNQTTDTLDSSLPYEAVGFSRPIFLGALAMYHLVYGFFYAPLSVVKYCLITQFVMVGVLGGFKPAVSEKRSTNLVHSPPKSLVAFGGDLKIIFSEAVVPKNNTQKPTLFVSGKNPQSLLNVLIRLGRSIARKIPFNKVIRLKHEHPEFTVKFDSMGGVA